jgi:hypothetical protein
MTHPSAASVAAASLVGILTQFPFSDGDASSQLDPTGYPFSVAQCLKWFIRLTTPVCSSATCLGRSGLYAALMNSGSNPSRFPRPSGTCSGHHGPVEILEFALGRPEHHDRRGPGSSGDPFLSGQTHITDNEHSLDLKACCFQRRRGCVTGSPV